MSSDEVLISSIQALPLYKVYLVHKLYMQESEREVNMMRHSDRPLKLYPPVPSISLESY